MTDRRGSLLLSPVPLSFLMRKEEFAARSIPALSAEQGLLFSAMSGGNPEGMPRNIARLAKRYCTFVEVWM